MILKVTILPLGGIMDLGGLEETSMYLLRWGRCIYFFYLWQSEYKKKYNDCQYEMNVHISVGVVIEYSLRMVCRRCNSLFT